MNDVQELLPFYALDVLTEEERMAVEAYLKNNPSSQTELAELNEATERLIQTIEPLTPNPQTKVNLMARVANSLEKPPAPAPVVYEEKVIRWWQRPLFQQAIPALGAALAIAMFIWSFTLRGSLNETRAQLTSLEATTTALEGELADLRLRNQTLAQELERETSLMQTLTSLNSEQVAFGSAESPHGVLTVNRSADTAFFAVTNLAELTADQTYQLWLIDDSGANSAGIFSVDAMGDGKLLIQSDALDTFGTLGISIEPSGGSATPTEVIFVEEL